MLFWYVGAVSGALFVEFNGEEAERLEAPLLVRRSLLRWRGRAWLVLLC